MIGSLTILFLFIKGIITLDQHFWRPIEVCHSHDDPVIYGEISWVKKVALTHLYYSRLTPVNRNLAGRQAINKKWERQQVCKTMPILRLQILAPCGNHVLQEVAGRIQCKLFFVWFQYQCMFTVFDLSILYGHLLNAQMEWFFFGFNNHVYPLPLQIFCWAWKAQ